ncbi:MAG: glutaredoxin 3 [Rhodospirillales bacterium]
MAKVEIYTTAFCPYCTRAKSLLKSKGVHFKEHDVMMCALLRRKMSEMAGGATSVPQIFVDGQHIGDSDGIQQLDAQGKLDAALGIAN